MTLPLLGFPLYRKFGYVYHPDYRSVYCDNEQTMVCAMLGKLAVVSQCIIRHEWTGEHFDVLHARNEAVELYDRDRAVLARRHAAGFDIAQLGGAHV